MHPLETYLEELNILQASGATVQETSGYGALANLLNALGSTLRPRVRCLLQLKNSGAGLPDGGLFTPDQLKNPNEEAPLLGQRPSRGVIEVKGADGDLAAIVETKQVRAYLAHYGQVLLTNYRDFLLLARGPEGGTLRLESFQLAESEAAFRAIAAHPRQTAALRGERFVEYLKRVLLHAAPLNDPRAVAFFLASYARDARSRVEAIGDLPALTAVRTALEEALGMRFEAAKGEHFFRSTLVQTLFYGVFSAWVLWHREKPLRRDAFDWRSAAWTLHVPMIKALFEQVATPTQLGPLGLVEVLDWTASALNRVDRAAFFQTFLESHAVQYFYEPFLEAFDPTLRKELGVWYTPPEIVQYQVARVEAALRDELHLRDGLADPRVYVLDPCCGTGAYLVEVLRRIHQTLEENQGPGALAGLLTKEAAQKRVFGFELLPAPFVVAHLQLGLLLQNLGLPLDAHRQERAAIYLTNALTRSEPPSDAAKRQLTLPIAEFQAEKAAADEIKQHKPILVILGNPPYNGYAGVAVDEERGLTEAYRATRHAPAPQGQGLNDLYVRFFRMAERRIIEKSGEGIVCFISNYSWLDGLSFSGMRERYLEVFDRITVDCLNGDKYKTGKLTPEGDPDPSVFSTESNREGIQVGTAIVTLVRRRRLEAGPASKKKRQDLASPPTKEVLFRHLWGQGKRAELLATVEQRRAKLYERLRPALAMGLPFVPAQTPSGFFNWPRLTELFPVSFPGVKTSRDAFLVDLDREVLKRRLEQYFNPRVSHEEMRRMAPTVMRSTARFRAEFVRDELRERGFLPQHLVRYCYRPFDIRWLYWEPQAKLLDEKRADYFLQVFEGNLWFSAGQRNRKEAFYQPQFTTRLADHHLVESNVGMFPLWLKPEPDPASLFDRAASDKPRANLSEPASEYLASLRLGNKPESLFDHTLAVLHAPRYRTQNAGALRQDWPRVPLPKSRETLLASAKLGRQVAALLDTESPVEGVTGGRLRPELKATAELRWAGEPDLRVTAGWGHAGKEGVTMPGKGKKLTRAYRTEEAPPEAALEVVGRQTLDIYLNDTAYWRNVPEPVWTFTIGGYQVLKKWLSYREYDLLGRPLTTDEARDFTQIARRIAALILLQPELDANYQAAKAAACALVSSQGAPAPRFTG